MEGYYDHLLQLFDHAVTERFLKPAHRQMVIADSRAEPLVERLLACQVPLLDKWMDRNET